MITDGIGHTPAENKYRTKKLILLGAKNMVQNRPQSFPYGNLCKCYKKLASRLSPVLFTLTFFFIYIHSPLLLENKKLL